MKNKAQEGSGAGRSRPGGAVRPPESPAASEEAAALLTLQSGPLWPFLMQMSRALLALQVQRGDRDLGTSGAPRAKLLAVQAPRFRLRILVPSREKHRPTCLALLGVPASRGAKLTGSRSDVLRNKRLFLPWSLSVSRPALCPHFQIVRLPAEDKPSGPRGPGATAPPGTHLGRSSHLRVRERASLHRPCES